MKITALFFLSFLLCRYAAPLDMEALLEQAGENSGEVEGFIEEAEEKGYGEWADFLLSSMPDVDLVSFESDDFIAYFDALDKNLQRVSWREKIDNSLFCYYILPHRVSQEPLDCFATLYADTLYGLIEDASNMRTAVQRINEWVYTKMKYEPTARWDQNALTTIRRGFGRCEEMAILCIKALRTVSIPARKVYAPWWPFTNSNHAWIEVWVDGKWHSIGGGEPTDLDNAWFQFSARRTAIVKGVIYGKIEDGDETIYKQEKGFTVINTTTNYTDVTELCIEVKEDDSPAGSVSVSICVYNYSSLPPVGLKKTDEAGTVKFIVGKTDLFVYASRDSLIGYELWRPSSKEKDTVRIQISETEIPDTSFWIYTRRIEKEKREPEYKPNRDSLKLLQSLHMSGISIVDSSLASVLCEKAQKLVKIFYHAKGGAKPLLQFYGELPDTQKDIFATYFSSLHPKDIVSLDTAGLSQELSAVLTSKDLASESAPDSVLEDYLISDRILFEQIGKWRKCIQPEFMNLRRKTAGETANDVFSWVEENVEKVEDGNYFGPMKNPEDVYKTGRGTDRERYIFIAGVLRSIGIPARVKWSYDAVEYWDEEWKERSYEEKEEEGKKVWLALKFEENGKDVTGKQRYYYDYSLTRFGEYPERLVPPVDTSDGDIIVTLDEDPAYNITGWRNGYGDTWVRIKKVMASPDTERVLIETGIPEEIRPGDLVVREYKRLEVEDIDIEPEELEKGEILIVVFDTESEASRSTLKNANNAINGFSGEVYLFAATEKKRTAEAFLKEMGIKKGSLYNVSEDLHRKKWKIKELPSIIYLRDGECVLWMEGLLLHLSSLLEDVKN